MIFVCLFFFLTATINWNVVESGVKHHKPNLNLFFIQIWWTGLGHSTQKLTLRHWRKNIKKIPVVSIVKPALVTTSIKLQSNLL